MYFSIVLGILCICDRSGIKKKSRWGNSRYYIYTYIRLHHPFENILRGIIRVRATVVEITFFFSLNTFSRLSDTLGFG